jgi:hypothetical protein
LGRQKKGAKSIYRTGPSHVIQCFEQQSGNKCKHTDHSHLYPNPSNADGQYRIRLEIEKIKTKLDSQGKNMELVFRYLDELIERKTDPVPRKRIGYKPDDLL